MRNQTIYNNITTLLKGRGWNSSKKNSKYDILSPPSQLNFSETYKLYLYNKFEHNDFEQEAIKLINIISSIYNEDLDELYSLVIEDKPVLSFRIISGEIESEHPNIPYFSNLISNSKKVLKEVANFSIKNKPHYFDGAEEAERYLNYCNFFKNDKGSLITKIQLPNNEEIKFENIYDESIKGFQINEKLIDITSFINNEIILNDNFEPDDEFLISNKSLISVNVTNRIRDLYSGIGYSDFELTLNSTTQKRSTSIDNLNEEKVKNLNTFSKTIKRKITEIFDNKVVGRIVALKSKDVKSDKNSVLIEATVNKVKTNISINLDSHLYQIALDLHKNNQQVSIVGTLEKEKTQYKIIDLKEFKAAS